MVFPEPTLCGGLYFSDVTTRKTIDINKSVWYDFINNYCCYIVA